MCLYFCSSLTASDEAVSVCLCVCECVTLKCFGCCSDQECLRDTELAVMSVALNPYVSLSIFVCVSEEIKHRVN